MYYLLFLTGSCLASFVDYLVDALIHQRFKFVSRSACGHCHHLLHPWQLIPILSYLLLRGHCHYCHARVPSHHLWIEVIGGICGLVLYLRFNLTYFYWGLFLLLLSMVAYDLLIRIVPDQLQLILFLFGLYFNWSNQIITWPSFILILLLTILLLVFANPWLGGADIKFITLACLFIPIIDFSLFILTASSLGLIYCFVFNKRELPGIPFLVLAFCFFI